MCEGRVDNENETDTTNEKIKIKCGFKLVI